MVEEQQWLNISQEIEFIIRLRYLNLKDELQNQKNLTEFLGKEVDRLKKRVKELESDRLK